MAKILSPTTILAITLFTLASCTDSGVATANEHWIWALVIIAALIRAGWK